ncbi:enoyl-CoA hydratase-related protein [Aquabacterium sp. OR-4]|uniref:enoyl-CoA hydratase-related protein n=1 Tax=Aquabacterium sp. OR-4 TaxID=2978127 RepID=UPI0028C73F22|nr:enoyl-CoA hydratase-related protein [Aquabacterium sp. OR-4]MDT7833614.1 enoyl-CoA hydratase-related protein [Aquabacterium sp. OR-4]
MLWTPPTNPAAARHGAAPADLAAASAVVDVGADAGATSRPLRILLLAHAFNSLTQRLHVALRAAGHQVSVELDIADAVTEEAVALADPDVLIAPFLKRRIPEAVWRQRVCLVVHPGPPGDRGPSALDWALLRQRPPPVAGPVAAAPDRPLGPDMAAPLSWGVTVLQATADFDAGRVWAWQAFAVRPEATKASLYRHEVVQAATRATLAALQRWRPGSLAPAALARPLAEPAQRTGWQPLVTRAMRQIDWARCTADTVLRLVRSADGAPGAAAQLLGQPVRLFDAQAATMAECAAARGAAAGSVLARRGPALLLRCADGPAGPGAVWIGQVRRDSAAAAASASTVAPLKLAATLAFAAEAAALPEWPVPLMRQAAAAATPQGGDLAGGAGAWDELHYSEFGPPRARVGWLEFNFHNGAMGERACRRLVEALRWARGRDTQVLVLAGGADFFSNGIHLHEIEHAASVAGDSAAEASLRAIEAIDDVALEILTLTDRLSVAALRGNAGAGGCFLALAADRVWAHEGVVLNPHYKNMGNLYGSEYWTYTLPRRIGAEAARALMQGRLPLGAAQAAAQGLIDDCFGADREAFEPQLAAAALALAGAPDWPARVQAKQAERAADEARRPLAAYRADELAQMRRNFFGFDPSYHVARHHFVHRKPHAWTPRHLATHRR